MLLGGGDFGGFELGVEEGAGGALQAVDERDKLRPFRHAGQHDGFGREAPADGVGKAGGGLRVAAHVGHLGAAVAGAVGIEAGVSFEALVGGDAAVAGDLVGCRDLVVEQGGDAVVDDGGGVEVVDGVVEFVVLTAETDLLSLDNDAFCERI